MFVGEAPGARRTSRACPSSAAPASCSTACCAAIGLDRTQVYIANIVPWRPPGNRTPTPQESQICLPFIRARSSSPIPTSSSASAGRRSQTLLGIKDGIMKTRGRWLTYHTGTREIRAMATLHPAYLLRQPLEKRLAWRDFLAIRKALG